MFPLAPIPRSRIAWIVTLADKAVASKEVTLAAGDFAENILTEGLTLRTLPVGTVLRAGEVRLEVTQIGKECHNDCEIRRMTGMCVMPTDGIFAVVLNEAVIRPGDQIEVESI